MYVRSKITLLVYVYEQKCLSQFSLQALVAREPGETRSPKWIMHMHGQTRSAVPELARNEFSFGLGRHVDKHVTGRDNLLLE